MLANLLIVGAMRSGTTSAYRYLSQHPSVFMAPNKEPHFFAFEGRRPSYAGPGDERLNRRVTTTFSDYERLFGGAGNRPWRGEASAMYLYLPQSLAAMQRHGIDPAVVVMLRNPVDRAYSSFQYQRFRGREPIERFEDALDAEADRVSANWSPMWHYRRAGLYADQVGGYLKAFGPERLHVILYEDLQQDPRATFVRLFRELGLRIDAPIDYDIQHNRSGSPRSSLLQRLLMSPGPAKRRMKRVLPFGLKRALERLRERNVGTVTPMQSDTRARLEEFFSDEIDRLEPIIDRDLSLWRPGLNASST